MVMPRRFKQPNEVLVAIDPGYAARGKGSAIAVFRAGVLVRFFMMRVEDARADDLVLRATHVVWECPQLDARSRVSAQSVLRLAAVGGVLAGLAAGANNATVEDVSPSEWKGSVPKPVHHGRMWVLLSDSERVLLGGDETARVIHAAKTKGARDRWGSPGGSYYPASYWMHNVLDAAGIGMWRVGRRSE